MTEEKINPVAIIESVLFMYGRSITFEKLGELLDLSDDEVFDAITDLQKEYENREICGLCIIIKDETVQMVTHKESAQIIEKITKKELEGPLTPVAMEVLSIIAYRGPISKVDIEAIRGVNCSFSVRNLLRRGLIERIHADKTKRVQQYQTTLDFLRLLGVESVEELPEFEELSTDKRIDAILYNENEIDLSSKFPDANIQYIKSFTQPFRALPRTNDIVIFKDVFHQHENQEGILKIAYTCLANAAEIIIMQKKSTMDIQATLEILEEFEFRSQNYIDVLPEYDLVMAKKLHMWGNGL